MLSIASDERGRRSKENCEIDAPPETRINNPNRSVARVLLAGCQFPLLLPGQGQRTAVRDTRDTPAWRVAHLCFQPSLLVADCAVRSGPLGAKPSASDAACAARRQSGGFRTAQHNSYTTAARQPTATAQRDGSLRNIRLGLGTAAAEEPSFRQQRAMVVSLRRQ